MIGKAELLEVIAGTNRGLLAGDRDRTAILAAIAQLEDRNPTQRPLESEWLEGDWRLLYTSSQDLLGLGRLPGVRLGQIYQCVRLDEAKIYNIAELEGIPGLESIVSVAARITPQSEQRVQVRFERSVIGLQRLLPYRSPGGLIATLQSGNPRFALDFTIDAQRQQGWLDITYLDANLRLGRGNEGSVFVLAKVKSL
ncbi:fibrillin [Synechococcales cyanobacterium C]|uniref:Fibrillin n=1 Tax=Petrachloros mirabilis ULC683 TaxID=2781853 RepID=A0A8K2A179_9CYAN|nr:PAP/fibrillin family protein [Petrachloros mirabilis]NCJ07751.1 fibrillin [Petrachloros mirabilis ULC683]